MDEAAWPFLIGRSTTEDHRVVVIPEFMTDPRLVSALRASAGGDRLAPGSALVREVRAAPDEALTVVYRRSIARADDFGIPGRPDGGVLTDSHDRPIQVTEGLVLRRPASDVMKSGIPQSALDQAHALVVPAYQAFWSQEGKFTRRVGRAFTVASNDSPRARLLLWPGSSPRPDGSTPDACIAPSAACAGDPAARDPRSA